MTGDEAKGWTGEALGRLYAECCRTREEMGIERVRRSFRVSVYLFLICFDDVLGRIHRGEF